MLKEHNISSDLPENPQSNHTSSQDHEHPDDKIGFFEKGRDLFGEPDSGDVGLCLKASKTGSGEGKTGNPSSQELTLSYLCDNPKMCVGDKEISGKNLLLTLEKGRCKGKEIVSEPPVEDDRWVERDFFRLNENRGSKRVIAAAGEEIVEEKTEKRAKLQTLNLSLGLPDVSLSLASSIPGMKTENADPGNAEQVANAPINVLKSSTRSIQSMAPSLSDDFTGPSLSYSHSHPFSHNPSCSLTRNSTENYEYSVGSRRRDSDQIWHCGEGTNGSVHSRFKPIGDSVNPSNNGGYPMMTDRAATVSKDAYNGLYRTNSSESLSFFPSELPARQRKDCQSADSRGRTSENRKLVDNGFMNSDGGKGFGAIRPEEILREIVSGSISITAQVLRELSHDAIEAVRECLKNLIGEKEKKEEFPALQTRLERRTDLTYETLSSAQRFQLEVFVTVKTGISTYISGKCHLETSELVEIFLLLRCPNIACKSLLPVDDCDCNICSKKGFCSACMCPICMKFDCASNTCSWVGCDVCSHWCHAACGMHKNLIRLSSSLKGGATAEMHFHCIGCGHASEMFGFVKDVFENCAKGWSPETLIKELDCVRKIFEGSVDYKGKEVHNKAEDMLNKLNKRLITPSDACNALLQFFKFGLSKFSGLGSSSKEAIQATQRADVLLPPPTSVLTKPSHDINSSSKVDTFQRSNHQSNISKAFTSEKTVEPELNFGVPKKDEFDSLEGIVQIKETEARFFQSRADNARREAEKFRQLVRRKSENLEEEYASKLAKLCLQETHERRRKKLEELKALENSRCDYYKMKKRMEEEIAGLLKRMEATKRQWV